MIAPIDTSAATAAATPSGVTAQGNSREDLKAAAKQFEAIFVRQMLASARKANFGDSLFGGQGTDTFRQMQDDKFAEIASNTGALGMGKMIEAHLARLLPAEAPAATTSKGGVNDGI